MIVLKGRIIDGTGGPQIEHGAVVLEGNKIKLVCRESELPTYESAEIIDVGDGTILPGFVDAHLHFGMGSINQMEVYLLSEVEKALLSVKEMECTLDAGFTSVREAGGISAEFLHPLAMGWIKGPRICSGGRLLSQTGGHGDSLQRFPRSFAKERMSHAFIVDGKDACREAARMQFRSGAKFLKIVTTGGISSQGDGNRESQFSLEEIKVFVEEAELHNTYVAAHAQGTQGIKNALKCGVKSIEHGMFMDDECIELMLKNDAYLVPTLGVVDKYLENKDKLPKWIVEKLLDSYEAHRKSVKACYKAGIKIALGTDMMGDPIFCPPGYNGLEFSKLTEIGMSNMEAIVAGTRTGSELMLMADKIGTLEAGKFADVAICSGNPLKDISAVSMAENIRMVISDGKVIKNEL